MTDGLNISWRLIGFCAAVFFVVSAVRRRLHPPQHDTSSPGAVTRASVTGRVGSHLVSHTILSIITGILGFSPIVAIGSLMLAIPLWLIGAEVRFPDWVMAWPRSVAARVYTTFSEKKEEVKTALQEKKEQVVEHLQEKKEEVQERIHEKVQDVKERVFGITAPEPVAAVRWQLRANRDGIYALAIDNHTGRPAYKWTAHDDLWFRCNQSTGTWDADASLAGQLAPAIPFITRDYWLGTGEEQLTIQNSLWELAVKD